MNWSLPTHIILQPNCITQLGSRTKGWGKRALIVTSSGFLQDGPRWPVLEAVIADLKKRQVDIEVFGDIEPNPRVSTIDRAATIARKFHPRFIVALGGGSVLDSAKALALLCCNEGSIWDYTYAGPASITGHKMKHFDVALPLVCLPTLAGTGSESNPFAVVTHDANENGFMTKSIVFGSSLLPTLALVDPVLTLTTPREQTIDGAFDCFTHSMETYFSSLHQYPFLDRFSEFLCETIVDALPQVLSNPADLESRTQLCYASTLALCGILSERDGGWPIHAIEHGISAVTNLGHGRGLSLLLPRVLAYESNAIAEKLIQFNRRLFRCESKDPFAALSDGLFSFMKRVEAHHTWSSLGIKNVSMVIEKTIEHTMRVDAVHLKSHADPYLKNIFPLKKKDIEQILLNCGREF